MQTNWATATVAMTDGAANSPGATMRLPVYATHPWQALIAKGRHLRFYRSRTG